MFTRVLSGGVAPVVRDRASAERIHRGSHARDDFDAVRFMRPRRWLAVDLAAFPVRVMCRATVEGARRRAIAERRCEGGA